MTFCCLLQCAIGEFVSLEPSRRLNVYNYSAVMMKTFLSYLSVLDLHSILQSAIKMETLILLLESRSYESKASMYIINVPPKKFFNANPHFFSQKSYSAYIPRKKVLTCHLVYKKAIIHEMYYEKIIC